MPKNLKNILIAKFKRSAIEGHQVLPFHEIQPEKQLLILRKASLEENDFPIICFYPRPDYWFLLTVRHLIIHRKSILDIEQIRRYQNKDIIGLSRNIEKGIDKLDRIDIEFAGNTTDYLLVDISSYSAVMGLIQYFLFQQL